MFNCLKCGTGSYRNAALTVAIIDIIFTSILLIMFVLGSTVLVAFEFVGSKSNATRALDKITDDVLGIDDEVDNIRPSKDVAEDMGMFLIFMFLSIVDFIISCIFFDGVKSKNIAKCQTWLDIRIVILIIFMIVVIFNIIYGSSWPRFSPEVVFAAYRVIGLFIGYGYFKEIREMEVCKNCNCLLNRPTTFSIDPNGEDNHRHPIINLGFRRKEVQKSMALEPPMLTVTGPESGRTTPLCMITPSQSSPCMPRVPRLEFKEMKI